MLKILQHLTVLSRGMIHMYLLNHLTNTILIRMKWSGILLGLFMIFHILIPKIALSAEVNSGKKEDINIFIGSIMQLTEDSLYHDLNHYSVNMRRGIEAALKSQPARDRRKIEFEVINDSNDPITTVQAARELMDKGLFLMLGNVGAVSTLKLIKVLEANQIPAMGFYTMGDFDAENMLSYRPNTSQEVIALIDDFVMKHGAKATQVCIFAQNDVFGMAGVNGLKTTLEKLPGTQTTINKLDHILDMMMGGINPALNSIGPVGFYQYETVFIREGYLSLKDWERESGNQCKLVILLAIPKVAADFIAYAHYKNESWSYGAVSITAAGDSISGYLRSYGIEKDMVVSQVVPEPSSSLPIVADARNALGDSLNHISLEGYIVGRMFMAILNSMKDPVTRANFIKAARQNPFDLGGLKIDFTQGNSGSTLISLNPMNLGSYNLARQ